MLLISGSESCPTPFSGRRDARDGKRQGTAGPMSKRRDGAHQVRVRACKDDANQASGKDAAKMGFGEGVRSSRRGAARRSMQRMHY